MVDKRIKGWVDCRAKAEIWRGGKAKCAWQATANQIIKADNKIAGPDVMSKSK